MADIDIVLHEPAFQHGATHAKVINTTHLSHIQETQKCTCACHQHHSLACKYIRSTMTEVDLYLLWAISLSSYPNHNTPSHTASLFLRDIQPKVQKNTMDATYL